MYLCSNLTASTSFEQIIMIMLYFLMQKVHVKVSNDEKRKWSNLKEIPTMTPKTKVKKIN